MKKQKQAWAAQIMDELISHTSMYAYEDGGDVPEQSEMYADQIKPYKNLDGDVTFHEDVVFKGIYKQSLELVALMIVGLSIGK